MSKHDQRQHQRPQAPQAPQSPTERVRLPGDHLSSAEQRESQEATLSLVKSEIAATAERDAAMKAQLRASLSTGDTPIQLSETKETAEQRETAITSTIDLIRQEMEEQAAIAVQPRVAHQGLDDASLDLIKAEMAKSHKRVVLPHG